ncbi:MAG: hypothetical protein E7605_08180 [Ruminococcaceae bacterium]|nr:hypothetical protein [Oscillospiraceae bacterium]
MFKKILLLVLSLTMMLVLGACQPAPDQPDITPPDSNPPEDNPPEDNAPDVIDLIVDSASDYTIVYDDSDPIIKAQVEAFVKRMDNNYFVAFHSVGISEAESDYGHEIVIGDMRASGREAAKQLKGGDFSISVVDDDLVMCASSSRQYAYLFDVFAAEFLVNYDDGKLSISSEQNFLYSDSEWSSMTYFEYLSRKGVSSALIEQIFEYRSFTAEDGTTLPYRLYVPYEYDESKEYPVLIVLHGAGQRGTDNLGGIKYILPQMLAHKNTPAAEAIIICPQCPEAPNQWVDTPWAHGNYSVDKVKISNELAAVMELLYAIEDEFSTDDNRYYVTGLSMGGFGTWDLLMRYPDVFAAGVPICGGADPSYAEVLKDVPIYTVHSTDDPTVPVMGTQAMVKALKEAGSLLIFYEELEGFGHGVWNWTAEQADIWEWLFTQNLSFR